MNMLTSVSPELKRQFTQKTKVLSLFTHPRVVPHLSAVFHGMQKEHEYLYAGLIQTFSFIQCPCLSNFKKTIRQSF